MDPAVVAELLDESEKQKPFDSDDEKTAVQEALELLKKSDEDCFYALWDNFVVGSTYDDMAARTGRTYDAVRMEVSRCLDKLEPLLKQILPNAQKNVGVNEVAHYLSR